MAIPTLAAMAALVLLQNPAPIGVSVDDYFLPDNKLHVFATRLQALFRGGVVRSRARRELGKRRMIRGDAVNKRARYQLLTLPGSMSPAMLKMYPQIYYFGPGYG